MFCKFCGKQLSNNAVFCSQCGKLLVAEKKIDATTGKISSNEVSNLTLKRVSSKFCKFCGKQIAGSARFCPKCGKNIVEKVPETVKPHISEPFAKPESVVQESQVIQTEQKHAEQTQQNNNTAFYSQGKFTVKNLFAQVFKKHTAQERDEILKAGLSEQDLSNVKISPEKLQPWFYSRVFLILLAVFGIFEICLLSFYNTNIMPGIMLIGSVMVPFSLLTMYFELNVYKDISFYKVIGIFLLGGAVSFLLTLFLYEIIPTTDDFNFLGASLISIIEEVGKAVVVILLLNRTKNATVLHGILIGGAIGCGFAVFESAGYAFNRYLDAHDYNTRADIVNSVLPWYYQYDYADSWSEMNFTIFLRSVLSFGGHTAWAAITGAAFAKAKKINLDFIKLFAICFVLHALWDTDTPAPYFKLISLCFVAWWVIIRQIANFVEENKLTIEK